MNRPDLMTLSIGVSPGGLEPLAALAEAAAAFVAQLAATQLALEPLDDLGGRLADLVELSCEAGAAAGTAQLNAALTDRGRNLLAAFRAGDADLRAVEQLLAHLPSSSVGCLTPPGEAESAAASIKPIAAAGEGAP